MIPGFNAVGYLPPGIHPATLSEIEARFGLESELRRVQMESLRWMVDLAWKAGAQRIIVNGSFVTHKDEPNDVDCVLLIDDNYPHDLAANEALLEGLPFLTIELANSKQFVEFTREFFGTDRSGVPKGLIEVQR